MKLRMLIISLACSVLISYAMADPTPTQGGSGGYSSQPTPAPPQYPSNTGSAATGATPTATPGSQDDSVDDALYRAPTTESLGSETMYRDEGALHEKRHPHEKVVEVDSRQKLKSSGVDPKFQGSLLDIGTNAAPKAPRESKNYNSDDPRFTTKNLSLIDELKKTEPSLTGSATSSSPSPSPSVTPSPTPKTSSGRAP